MLPLYSKEELGQLNFDLEGKTAIITGGTAGIGNATVEYFLAQGANVVMSGRNPAVYDMAREMGGSKAVGVQGNICDSEHCKELVRTAAEQFGQIDILVNCAGTTILGNSEDLAEEDWKRLIEEIRPPGFFMARLGEKYWMEQRIKAALLMWLPRAE